MEENFVFPCPGCGNQLFAKDAIDGLVECDHCGQLRAIPRADSSERAVHFLLVGEHELDTGKFNEAYDAYAKAAELSPKEPEAFFGMALSELQVRYIKDEVNNRLQPICYEISPKKFEDNVNYKKALTLATVLQKAEYEKRAKAVDYIKKEFYNLQQSGLDYDCFICVKVTDENGEKTDDSGDAEYIYDLLKRNGFTPFYSEREIRNRQGVDYEAAILYALHTSETMLVVCHKEEYLNTKWVKNEYTRFLKLQNDGEKECDSISIIFYEKPIGKLPGRNGQLQGIDFESRAADGQILEFVKNHTPEARKRKEEEKRKKEAEAELLRQQIEEQKRAQRELEKKLNSINGSAVIGGATANTLLKRASLELSQGYADKAAESCNKTLDIDPENSNAWWFLFLLDFGVANEQELLNNLDAELWGKIFANRNYKNAVKYAPDDNDNRVKIFEKAVHSPEKWWSLFLAEMKVTDEKYILNSINAARCKAIDNSKNYAYAVKYADENFKPRLQNFINKRYSAESCWKLFLEELGAEDEESLLAAVNPIIFKEIVGNKNFDIARKSAEGKVNELAFTDASGAKHIVKNAELDKNFKKRVDNFCDWLYSGEFWWKKFLKEYGVLDEKELFTGITPDKKHHIEQNACFLNAYKFASEEFKVRIKSFEKQLNTAEMWWDRFLYEYSIKDENSLLENFDHTQYAKIRKDINFIKSQKYCGQELKDKINAFEKGLVEKANFYNNANERWQRLLSEFGCENAEDLKQLNKLICESENYKAALTLAEKSTDKALINFYKATERANNKYVMNLRANRRNKIIKRLTLFAIGIVPSLIAIIIGCAVFYEKMHVAMKVSMFLLMGIGIVYQFICLFLSDKNYGRQPIKAMQIQLLSFALFIGGYAALQFKGDAGDFVAWCIFMLIPAALAVCYLTQIKAVDNYDVQDNILLRFLPVFVLLAGNTILSLVSNESIPLWHVLVQLILTLISVGIMIGLYLSEYPYWANWIVFGVFALLSIIIVLFWFFWKVILIALAVLIGAAIVIGIIIGKVKG